MVKNSKNCTKSAISQFGTYAKLQSESIKLKLKKLHALNFSMFPEYFAEMASRLRQSGNSKIEDSN